MQFIKIRGANSTFVDSSSELTLVAIYLSLSPFLFEYRTMMMITRMMMKITTEIAPSAPAVMAPTLGATAMNHT